MQSCLVEPRSVGDPSLGVPKYNESLKKTNELKLKLERFFFSIRNHPRVPTWWFTSVRPNGLITPS